MGRVYLCNRCARSKACRKACPKLVRYLAHHFCAHKSVKAQTNTDVATFVYQCETTDWK